MPSPLRLTQLLVIVLAIAGCKRNTTPVPAGDIAGSLALPALGATAFDPESLRGKPSLVMFVTPTCPHCLATLPRGAAAAQAKGANVVAVFVTGGKQNAEGVISHIKFPGIALVDEGRTMIKQYEIKGVPYSLVLGPDGRARSAFRGEQETSTFEDALASAR
jgi:thiol-disulfide isomerase/thioredoxin